MKKEQTVTKAKAKPAAKKSVKKAAPKKKVVAKKAKPVLPKTVQNTKKIQAAQFKAEVAAAKAMIVQQTKFHLEQVLATTGKIHSSDKKYCKDLGGRILEKKFPGLKVKL